MFVVLYGARETGPGGGLGAVEVRRAAVETAGCRERFDQREWTATGNEPSWRLEVTGLVENPLVLDWDAFLALPQVDDESDFHCVTTWSRMDNRWRGVRLRDLAALARPTEEARFLFCTGHDRDPGSGESYTTNLPLDRALDPDVLLVHTWEGQPLPREHGGPVRMITPRLYAWKGTKWIKRIEFLAQDRPGFWEERGYSDSAEPWLDDRYRR